MHTIVIDQNGQRRELQDGEIIKSGERIVVPLTMMDQAALVLHDGMGNAACHKPGYAFASESSPSTSDAAAVHDEYEAKLTNAWRNPVRSAPADNHGEDDIYAAYETQLINAWRPA